ncbi:unnamed protein product [Blepharisma stoltei]|uniref:Uncharacterized protein n=1 Tax=Blepharisma stoltei TaxID=1481888 RepID=A0AAU9JAG9_9CILI|nr:unnamed protein product [Blepharisma stoltei]
MLLFVRFNPEGYETFRLVTSIRNNSSRVNRLLLEKYCLENEASASKNSPCFEVTLLVSECIFSNVNAFFDAKIWNNNRSHS